MAQARRADFVFTVMAAWALPAEHANRYEEVIERYGSIGESPYRLDVVSFSLETHWEIWMVQAPIEEGEGGSRTFAEPDCHRYPQAHTLH